MADEHRLNRIPLLLEHIRAGRQRQKLKSAFEFDSLALVERSALLQLGKLNDVLSRFKIGCDIIAVHIGFIHGKYLIGVKSFFGYDFNVFVLVEKIFVKKVCDIVHHISVSEIVTVYTGVFIDRNVGVVSVVEKDRSGEPVTAEIIVI